MSAPILITGFHRSGTSAIARALHGAGVGLGANLLGSEPTNPYGHFEDVDVIELHDGLLARESLTWKSLESPTDREAATAAVSDYVLSREENSGIDGLRWGVKDPRMCLFLGSWLEAAPDAEVVFVVRAPGPAVASLHRRHIQRHVDTGGIDPSDLNFWREPDLGLKLWLHYHRAALPHLESPRTSIIFYDDAASVDSTLRHLGSKFGLSATPTPLDPALGRIESLPTIDTSLIADASALWDRIHDLRDR